MNDFPDFMKDPANRVPTGQQHTRGAEGYLLGGRGDVQVAFWKCAEAQQSEWHANPFDEYLVVVAGEYVLLLEDESCQQVLRAGDEVKIPGGVRQAARVAAGTRTIHAFGGSRVVMHPDDR